MEKSEAMLGWTFDLVEERLIEAVDFLDRHVRGGKYPFAGDGPWNLVVRDNRAALQADGEMADHVEPESDAQVRRRSGLRTAEVDRMNEALGWVEMNKPKGEIRKLVHAVCQWKGRQGSRVSWPDVKRSIRSKQSVDALRMTYSRAIGQIAATLNVRGIAVSR